MGYLNTVSAHFRSLIKQVLPAPLLQAVRDVKYTDTPADSEGYSQQSHVIRALQSHYWPRKRIYFFPERPLVGSLTEAGVYRGSVAYKLCRLLGYGITTSADDPYDVAFKYERGTFSAPLSESFERDLVINGTSTDISKRTVNVTFENVFGYSVGVDPTTYDGPIVVKSVLNATHDGSVVEGPLPPAEVEEENAYQRVIDNTVPDKDYVLDYRVPVHGNHIPLVYLKYRPVESRFDSKSVYATLKEPTEVFTKEELEKLIQFARGMGIDFGELDVLRDSDDDRAYVVDANSAPWGLPRGMDESDRQRALALLKRSFEQLICTYVWRRESSPGSFSSANARC